MSDLRARALARAAAQDGEAQVDLLRVQARGGEVPLVVLQLRALSGDPTAAAALALEPPRELAAWCARVREVDRASWVRLPLVGAGLCARRLGEWPAGESTSRVLGLALLQVAGVLLGEVPLEEGLSVVCEAALDVDELRQLMESILAEHRLSVLRDPRALSCGLAGVEALQACLDRHQGTDHGEEDPLLECARALGGPAQLHEPLRASLRAAAARWR